MPPPVSGADPTSSASTTRCRATTTGACASTSSSRTTLVAAVDAHLAEQLPESFAGHPTRFATTWDPVVRHRVQVETARDLAVSRLGVDPTTDLTVGDWLSLTGQAVLEVTAGEVFADDAGELDGIRRRLEWYPDDVWRHVVATDWARLGQELPFVGRTGERGDDLGSRVVAARLAGIAMHLGHLLERRWPPYAKWLGTSFARLPRAGAVGRTAARRRGSPRLARARGRPRRGAARAQPGAGATSGCPTVDDPVEPFWDRPYRGVRGRRRRGRREHPPTRPCGRCREGSARPSSGATTSTCSCTPVDAGHHGIEWPMMLRLVW